MYCNGINYGDYGSVHGHARDYVPWVAMYRPVSTEHVLERILRIFCVRGTRAEQAPLLQKSLRTMRIADVSISTDCRAD